MPNSIRHQRLATRLLGLWLWLCVLAIPPVQAIDTAPLDTSSPRATFESFLALTDAVGKRYLAYLANPGPATQQRLVRALDQGQYLMDLSAIAPTARREVSADAVMQLWDLIAKVELPDSTDIPDAAAFADNGSDRRWPQKWRIPNTGITIARVEDGPQAGDFLITAATIAALPRYVEATRSLPYLRQEPVDDLTDALLQFSGWMLPPSLVARLPDWARYPIAGQVLWKWALVAISTAIAAGGVFLMWRWVRRQPPDWRLATLARRLIAPFALLLLSRLLQVFLDNQVHTTGIAVALPDYLAEIATGVGLFWIMLTITAWIPQRLIGSSWIAPESLDASLIRLLSRIMAALAILIFGFTAAHNLGIPVFGLVAGAGVGGLAIALAARPTLENFIGALNLFADRPIRIGDLCRFDERHGQGWNPVGKVEEIGLRSTKIRQFDRSLISIPNADLAERNIVNLSACETFLLHQRIPLRHETSDDQFRYLLARLRELMHGHPKTIHTAADPIRVRLLGFVDHQFKVEIRAYIHTSNYSEFLAIQEDIVLRAIGIVRRSGTDFAVPARTLHIARDQAIGECQDSCRMTDGFSRLLRSASSPVSALG